MDIEIDDRDPLGAIGGLGMAGSDGRIVEEAKAHRHRPAGMMAGRARHHKGIAGLPAHDRIDGGDGAAGRMEHRLP